MGVVNKIPGFLVGEHQKGSNFLTEANQPRMKLWYRAMEILINTVLDLIHKENIKKTGEAITPIVGTAKLSVSKYSFERSQGQRKKWSKSGKN